MVVSPPVNPSVSISTPTQNTICFGTNVTFAAAPVNGGSSPFYQWKKNGTNVGINSDTYSDNSLISSDIITCSLTSNGACVSGNAVTSNPISVSVYPVA